jgi:hypothetical protein
MNTERRLFVTIIAATAILASAIGAGLAKVGSGFATRAGDGITVTGSAKVTAKADKAVWTLNSQASAPSQSASVTKVEDGIVALKSYLEKGGVPADAVELGAVSTYPNYEYVNGNATGRVLSYQGNRTLTVRTNDVALVKKLSDGIGSLLQTGVNISNYGPNYYVSNLAELRPDLLAAAMKDAKLRAQSIMKATGGKLGAALNVKSGPTQVTSPESTDTAAGGYYDTSTIDKSISITVTVTFKTK